MRFHPNISVRRSYVKQFWKETRRTLVKCRQQVIDMIDNTDPENLKAMTESLLLAQPMVDQLNRIWSKVGGRFGYETAKKLASRKKADDDITLENWERIMRIYSNERSLLKAKKILSTEAEAINKVIDAVLQEGLDQGLGIVEIRKLLKFDLSGEAMTALENWQAQRIAMTEVGRANNTGSFMAAMENPEGTKKVWMFFPGRKTFRDNHQDFEGLGPQEMNYEFAPGLAFPGDERAPASETINCYCSIGYVTDN